MTYVIADMEAFYACYSIDKKLALFCYPSGTSNKIYIPIERDLYHFYWSFNFTFLYFQIVGMTNKTIKTSTDIKTMIMWKVIENE